MLAPRNPVLRAALLLVLVAFSGCTANVGFASHDIEAPAPVDRFPSLKEVFAEDEPFTLRGRVLAGDGSPVVGAWVWVESEDLRWPVNNLQAYEEGRNETRVQTDMDGAFRISADDGLYSVAVQAPGFRPLRSVPAQTAAPFDLRLNPAFGMDVLAHRGASYYAPENTIPAIQKAAWLGADWVEVDVRATKDGQLVLMHDANLTRTTNGHGEVSEIRWSQIRGLDAGSWFDASFRGERIPTLLEAMDTAQEEGIQLILDLKAPNADEASRVRTLVFRALQQQDREEEVLIAAFRNATLDQCVRWGFTCAKISKGAEDMQTLLLDARGRGAVAMMLNQSKVDEDVIAYSHEIGLKIYAWTVNDEPTWHRLLGAGADGVLTDRPGYLLDVLNGRPSQEAP